MLRPDPGAEMLVGEKLAVIPLGSPLTDRFTAALNVALAVVVTVTVAWPPAAKVAGLDEMARVNVGTGRMVSVMFAVLVNPPPDALMVSV